MSTYIMYDTSSGVKLFVGREYLEEKYIYGYRINSDVIDYNDVNASYEVEFIGDNFDASWFTYKDGLMADDVEYIDSGNVSVIKGGEYVYYDFERGLLNNWRMYVGDDGNGEMVYNRMSCCDDEGNCDCGEIGVESKFSSFVSGNGMSKFGGTGIAVGVYEDNQGKRVFFTNRFIDEVISKYGKRPSDIKVDWNHDRVYVGELSSLEVKQRPVYRVFVRGDAGRPVPDGSGLSIDFRYMKVWNEEFKVFEARHPVIRSVSVLSTLSPGCKICYVKK